MKYRFLFVLILAPLFVSCASMDNNSAYYNIIVNETVPLKENGPNQTTPATQNLIPGDRVRIINNLGTHVYIETVDGQRGFIPKDCLELQGDY